MMHVCMSVFPWFFCSASYSSLLFITLIVISHRFICDCTLFVWAILKDILKDRHPCRTPTVVRNQSSTLLLKRTALVALLQRFLMTWIRFVLMLYFFMVAHKAACQILSKAFLKSMKIWQRSCWCWRYFSQRIRRLKICSVVLLPALKPACSSAMILSVCDYSLFSMIFSMTLLGWLMKADRSVVLALLQVTFLGKCDD